MRGGRLRRIQAAKIQEDAKEKALCVNYSINQYLKAIPSAVTLFSSLLHNNCLYFPPTPLTTPWQCGV